MEAVNGGSLGEDKGGPPPPSPLTGCYLLVVIGEPHSGEHKDIILQKVAKGLLSWDLIDCLVDLEKELAVITNQGLEGEEARYVFENLGVVGGEDAKQGEFPYMVSLKSPLHCHYCGGSIIGEKWILTAAHCIDGIQDGSVTFGTVNLNYCRSDTNFSVAIKRAFTMPSFYIDVIAHNDVGLVELEEPLVFSENIQPVKLPEVNATLPFNHIAVLTGWGISKESTTPDTLQKVNLTLFDDDYCLSNLDNLYFKPAEMTCAGNVENTKGQCSGDSGGPLVVDGIQYGIVSWSYKPCGSNAGAFTRLPVYRDYVKNQTGICERLIQFASENLVTEILIHPAVSTLSQCVRNLLSSFTRHRHIIHAGYSFQGNGSWALQDGTFSYSDFAEAFQEIEVQRVLRAYDNGISIHLHCSPEGDWTRLPKENFAKACKVRVNPTDVLTTGSPSISNFIKYLSPFLVPTALENILESSDVVGNIRFSRPTLYVFPGGQGDAALFGINGFNMLLDGGYSRKACFWDFVRHLDRLDAVLMTRLNNSSVSGISSVLKRKRQDAVYPQIGHFFCNIQERKSPLSPDGDKDKDPLIISLLEEGQSIVSDLRLLNLYPQSCYRDSEPVILYHKVGHGTLNMYVLSPDKNSKEVREFLQKWNQSDPKVFSNVRKVRDFNFPLQNLVSVCALLIWQPANPNDTITRILYPGSTPQNNIFEGLDRLKSLEYIKHPICSEKLLAPVKKTKQEVVMDKILAKEKPILEKKSENKVLEDALKNGQMNGDVVRENQVKKSDSVESDKTNKAKRIEETGKFVENGYKGKPKPRTEFKQTKERSESQKRKKPTGPAGGEKKGLTTPKKILENKTNGEVKEKKAPLKPSPSATPAKSTKDATNRKVIESRKTPPKKESVSKPLPPVDSKPKPERKPISRRPKAAKPPLSPVKKLTNGVQKPDSLSKRGKLDKEGTTDSSTVSTPSADQESILKKDISKMTPEEIQQFKEKEIEELKEEQEAIKEIEAVFRKSEDYVEESETGVRKIKDNSIDDKLEPEEYLIIEKEEIDNDSLDEKEAKEDEMQKLARDSEESEKQRKLSGDEEAIKITKISNGKFILTDTKEEGLKSTEYIEEKKPSVVSPESKATPTNTDKKELAEEEVKEVVESHPEEKVSANVESGATTTAPTLPEDERITLDEIKEDNVQVIEEKHVKEETKEKDLPIIQLPPKSQESTGSKLPPVVGISLDRQKHIKDIVKTPDEVADLPVHEEADYNEYQSDEKKINEVELVVKEHIIPVPEEKIKKKGEEGKDVDKKELDDEVKEINEVDLAKTYDILEDEQKIDKKCVDVREVEKVEHQEVVAMDGDEKIGGIREEVALKDKVLVTAKEDPHYKEDVIKQNIIEQTFIKEKIDPKDESKLFLKEEKNINQISKTDSLVVMDLKDIPTVEKPKDDFKEITTEATPTTKEREPDNIIEKTEKDFKEKVAGIKEFLATEKINESIDEEWVVITKEAGEIFANELQGEDGLGHKQEDIEEALRDVGILEAVTALELNKTEVIENALKDPVVLDYITKDEIENKTDTKQENADNQLPTVLKEDETFNTVNSSSREELKSLFEAHKSEVSVIDNDNTEIEEIETNEIRKEDEIETADDNDDDIKALIEEADKKHIFEKKLETVIDNNEVQIHDKLQDLKMEAASYVEKELKLDHAKQVLKEELEKITKIDDKLQELKSTANDTFSEHEEIKVKQSKSPEHAEQVVLSDSSPEDDERGILKDLDIDKTELGRKSPAEREEDVKKIVASVAEVLKSEAPLEEFHGKLPLASQSFQELRETHITTQDSPIMESKLIRDDDIPSIPEEPTIILEEEINGAKDKRKDLIAEAQELIAASSKVISEIKSKSDDKDLDIELANTDDVKMDDEDAGTVHRMLVTTSSEDGGEEIEICPAGTIIFSKSSESSGRSSPDPSQKASQKSSIVETLSETLSTVKQITETDLEKKLPENDETTKADKSNSEIASLGKESSNESIVQPEKEEGFVGQKQELGELSDNTGIKVEEIKIKDKADKTLVLDSVSDKISDPNLSTDAGEMPQKQSFFDSIKETFDSAKEFVSGKIDDITKDNTKQLDNSIDTEESLLKDKKVSAESAILDNDKPAQHDKHDPESQIKADKEVVEISSDVDKKRAESAKVCEIVEDKTMKQSDNVENISKKSDKVAQEEVTYTIDDPNLKIEPKVFTESITKIESEEDEQIQEKNKLLSLEKMEVANTNVKKVEEIIHDVKDNLFSTVGDTLSQSGNEVKELKDEGEKKMQLVKETVLNQSESATIKSEHMVIVVKDETNKLDEQLSLKPQDNKELVDDKGKTADGEPKNNLEGLKTTEDKGPISNQRKEGLSVSSDKTRDELHVEGKVNANKETTPEDLVVSETEPSDKNLEVLKTESVVETVNISEKGDNAITIDAPCKKVVDHSEEILPEEVNIAAENVKEIKKDSCKKANDVIAKVDNFEEVIDKVEDKLAKDVNIVTEKVYEIKEEALHKIDEVEDKLAEEVSLAEEIVQEIEEEASNKINEVENKLAEEVNKAQDIVQEIEKEASHKIDEVFANAGKNAKIIQKSFKDAEEPVEPEKKPELITSQAIDTSKQAVLDQIEIQNEIDKEANVSAEDTATVIEEVLEIKDNFDVDLETISSSLSEKPATDIKINADEDSITELSTAETKEKVVLDMADDQETPPEKPPLEHSESILEKAEEFIEKSEHAIESVFNAIGGAAKSVFHEILPDGKVVLPEQKLDKEETQEIEPIKTKQDEILEKRLDAEIKEIRKEEKQLEESALHISESFESLTDLAKSAPFKKCHPSDESKLDKDIIEEDEKQIKDQVLHLQKSMDDVTKIPESVSFEKCHSIDDVAIERYILDREEQQIEDRVAHLQKSMEDLTEINQSVSFEKCQLSDEIKVDKEVIKREEKEIDDKVAEIKESYQAVTDMNKSISFEKCHNQDADAVDKETIKKEEKQIDDRVLQLQKNLEEVTDIAQSISFEKCKSPDEMISKEKSEVENTAIKKRLDGLHTVEDVAGLAESVSIDKCKIKLEENIRRPIEDHDIKESIFDKSQIDSNKLEFAKESYLHKESEKKAQDQEQKEKMDQEKSEQKHKDSVLKEKVEKVEKEIGDNIERLKETFETFSERVKSNFEDIVQEENKLLKKEEKNIEEQLEHFKETLESLSDTTKSINFYGSTKHEKVEKQVDETSTKDVTYPKDNHIVTNVISVNEKPEYSQSEKDEKESMEKTLSEKVSHNLQVQGQSDTKKLSISDVEISIKTDIYSKDAIQMFISNEKDVFIDDITDAKVYAQPPKVHPSPIDTKATVISASSSVPPQVSSESTRLSEKSSPEIELSGKITPPTAPVSPMAKDLQSSETKSLSSKLDSGLSEQTETDDEDLSTKSQVAHSQSDLDDMDMKVDPMSMSFYGTLPKEHPAEHDMPSTYLYEITKAKYATDVQKEETAINASEIDLMTESFIGELPTDSTFDNSTQAKSKDAKDAVDSWGKPLSLPAPTYLYEVTKAKFSTQCIETDSMKSGYIGEHPSSSSSETKKDQKQVPDPMTTSVYFDHPPDSGYDPIASWGKPLGLPSPAPPNNEKGTPKKEKKLPAYVTAKNKLNDDKKRSESPSKLKSKKISPVYVDLTYVPHHGNHYYSYVDFFKKIRARYYVFSGLEPSRQVYDALLEAKQTWEDKELEVTIIPTYDTDILGYWVAENEELLTKFKIDLSPSASRCTINLQDHETSCSAYRLEF